MKQIGVDIMNRSYDVIVDACMRGMHGASDASMKLKNLGYKDFADHLNHTVELLDAISQKLRDGAEIDFKEDYTDIEQALYAAEMTCLDRNCFDEAQKFFKDRMELDVQHSATLSRHK